MALHTRQPEAPSSLDKINIYPGYNTVIKYVYEVSKIHSDWGWVGKITGKGVSDLLSVLWLYQLKGLSEARPTGYTTCLETDFVREWLEPCSER
jgi:hypothetical protein